MPINPNIALGIQQPQPVNMLGQMGQMMALKAAQQETEGYEGVKSAIIGGMDAADPRMLQFGKRGIEAFRAAGEGRVKQQDALTKAYLNQRKSLDFVSSPEDLLAHGLSQFNDPVIAPQLKAQGLTPEKLTASFQKQLSTEGFESLLKKRAMGLDDWYKDQTSRRNTDVSATAPMMNARLNQRQFDLNEAELEELRKISNAGTPSATASPVNLGGGVVVTNAAPIGAGGGGPAVAPVAGGPASTNVLRDQVAAPVSTPAPVNGLLNPPAGETGAAPVMSQKEQLINQIRDISKMRPSPAVSRALDMKIKEHNVLYPDAKVDQDVNGNLISIVNGKATPVVDRNGNPVKGKPIPETSFEKTVRAAVGEDVVKAVKRAEVAPRNIQKIDETLSILSSGGAITGFGADLRLNVERAMSLYGADIKAGRRVADTQILDALLGSDVFPSLQSMGLGSKNIDTPAEREYLRQVMTGTIKMDRDALVRLTRMRRQVEVDGIKDYNDKIDSGKLNNYFKATDQTPEKIEIPNKIIRSGTHKDGRQVNEYADGTIEYAN
jgi:hypothetical protein